MKSIIAMATLLLSLGLVSAVALSKEDETSSSQKLAEFKGHCLRMNGQLKFDNKQWACHAKKTESGLTPIPVYLPKS